MGSVYVSLLLPATIAVFIGLSLTCIIYQIWIVDHILRYCGGTILIITAAWKLAQKVLDKFIYPKLIVDPTGKAVLITGEIHSIFYRKSNVTLCSHLMKD